MNKIDIKEYLKQYKNEEIIYCPNPGNIGDGLIAFATYCLFDEIGLSYKIVKLNDFVEPGRIIFYGGGGNLIEGLYEESINFIRNNISNCKEMLILPHTILGFSKFFNESQEKLKIICREEQSYHDLIKGGFSEDKLLIDHDLAFYFAQADFLRSDKIIEEAEAIEAFYCFRQDGEKTSNNIPSENFDISLTWNGSIWHNKNLAKFSSLSVASYLQSYQTIHTNRLHIAILSMLLGKHVFLYANSYFKNKAVYEYSISGNYTKATFFDRAL